MHTDKFTGIVVFNVRGGCLFVEDGELAQAESRMFGEGPVATLNTLELDLPEQKTCTLKKIKIKLARAKEIGGEKGIVFKFVQTPEEYIDLLNVLVDRLPHVDSDTEVIPSQLKKSA